MKESKLWWLSNGVRGGLATLILWVGNFVFNVEMDKATIEEILTNIIGPITTIWAIWGRAVATEKIKWRD